MLDSLRMIANSLKDFEPIGGKSNGHFCRIVWCAFRQGALPLLRYVLLPLERGIGRWFEEGSARGAPIRRTLGLARPLAPPPIIHDFSDLRPLNWRIFGGFGCLVGGQERISPFRADPLHQLRTAQNRKPRICPPLRLTRSVCPAFPLQKSHHSPPHQLPFKYRVVHAEDSISRLPPRLLLSDDHSLFHHHYEVK